MQTPETEVVVTGPEGAELLRTILRPGAYVLGRSAECELRFEAELVSRKHAMLTINFDHALIEDLGSSNGTFVNGQAITECTRLWPNQKIQIGSVTVELHRVKTAPPPDVSLAPMTATVRRILPEEFLRDKKYDIGGVVAQGGMGAILDVKEATIERKVAMKVMLDGYSPDDLTRFIGEAKITGQLEHPNIVPVHELGVDENDQVFYTMKFVRGITLRKVLDLMAGGTGATIRKYPLATLLTIFQKVCDAVAFAHSKSVIHRDLKPENLMLGDFGEVLVMDWGLAKLLSRDGTASPPNGQTLRSAVRPVPLEESQFCGTLDGSIMGTPQYMAPEQARGEVDALDARTDIYSLGAILFHLLYLRAPVSGGRVREVVAKVADGHLDWPDAKAAVTKKLSHLPGGQAPASLVAVCRKALALEPAERYSGIAGLQKDIAAYQAGFATSAEKAGLGKQLVLLIKRHKGIFATAAAAWALITALAVWFLVTVTASERRATRALADLQKTAPTLIAEGRKLIDAQQFDDALARISFAVQIEPRDTGYRLLRAQLLEAMLRLDQAAAEFRRVLATGPDPSAQANLALCAQLLAKHPTPESLDAVAMQQLYEQFRREGRNAQAVPLAARLGKSRETVKAVLESKLAEWRKLPGWEKMPESERIKQNADGSYDVIFADIPLAAAPNLGGLPVGSVSLYNTGVSDLRPLAGLSLTSLRASTCRITDLAPLRGMPLRLLEAVDNPQLRDLSPLEGMPLRNVNVANTAVEDLRPLRGSPVMDLTISGCRIPNLSSLAGLPLAKLKAGCAELTDISAVREMPLREIRLSGCFRLRDFSPLLDCPRLEYAAVPQGVPEVEVLRRHPRLLKIGYLGLNPNGWPPAEQFWDEFSTDFRPDAESEKLLTKARAAAAAIGESLSDGEISAQGKRVLSIVMVGHSGMKRLPDFHGLPVTWIYLQYTPFDLSPFAGLPLRGLSVETWRDLADLAPLAQCKELRTLELVKTKVSDLSPLRGFPLTRLDLSLSLVSDITPLRGMPLRRLSLQESKVSALSPLAEMTELRDLMISDTKVTDLRPLRTLRLEQFLAARTGINDIAPLAGQPLRVVALHQTAVRDLRPLLDCPDLEEATILRAATNAEVLRHHPKLRRLSYDWDGIYDGPAQTTEEFWKEYDAAHGAPK